MNKTDQGLKPKRTKDSEVAEALREIQETQSLQTKTLAKIERWYEEQQKNIAYVTSAVSLTGKQKEDLQRNLGFIFGKTFLIENKVDEKVLGGLRIRIGSQIIDATLLNQLEKLKSLLVDSI